MGAAGSQTLAPDGATTARPAHAALNNAYPQERPPQIPHHSWGGRASQALMGKPYPQLAHPRSPGSQTG